MARVSQPAMMDMLEPRLLLSAVAVMSENFEDVFPGLNWTTNTSQSRYWKDTSAKAHAGGWSGYCSYTANGIADYTNNQDTYMQQTVNLQPYNSAALIFYYWMDTEPNYDFLRVKVNGTTLWSQSGHLTSWNQAIVDLGSYAGQNNVIVKFEFTSDGTNTVAGGGAYVDDIVLTGATSDTDDQISEAGAIGLGVTRANQQIAWPTDVNMYAVSVSAGQTVAFNVDSNFDSYIRLFNSGGGTELFWSDNQAAPGETDGVDPYFEYTFATAGTYYVGVSSAGNSGYNATTGDGDTTGAMGTFSLTVTAVDSDLDDTLIYATNASLGSVVSGQAISTGADVDMYAFTVPAFTRVAFDIDWPAGSSLDSYLRVFDGDGVEIAVNDDHAGPGEAFTRQSYLEYTFVTAGTYYVGVSSFDNYHYDAVYGTGDASSASTGAYTLTLTQVDLDPDDNILYAPSISVPAPATGKAIDAATDVDMYALTVPAGQTVGFDVDSNFDSYMRLFDSNGTELLWNNNQAAPGETSGTDAYFEYTFAAAGTYYVGVSGAGNGSYSATTGAGDLAGATGTYSLTLTALDSDPNDTITFASNIVIGTPVTSQVIDTATDVDMYAFTVTAGQSVGFDVDSNFDSYMRVFNSSGGALNWGNNHPAPGESNGLDPYFECTFATAGTYYVGVSGNGNGSYDAITGQGDTTGATGAYSLTLTQVDNDPNDCLIYAPYISVGTTTTGASISTPTEVDMYSFIAAANTRLSFDTDMLSGSLDSFLRVFDSSGNELACSDDRAAPGEIPSNESYTEYTFSTDGTYYVGVSAFANIHYDPVYGTGDVTTNTTGAYSLTVAQVDLDPDDNITFAYPVTMGVPLTDQAISSPTDVNMYSVNVTAGQRVCFDIDAGWDTFIRLFNSDGTQLAGSNNAPAPGETPSLDSYLEYTFPTAGKYYLGVSGNGNTTYSAVYGTGDVASIANQGAYDLTVSLDADPDETIPGANAAAIGAPITGNAIDSPTDVDLFAVAVTAGQRVCFDIDRPSGTLDSYIRLFNSAGTQLAGSNNAPAPGETASTDSYLEYTFATAGTYYLGVSGASNNTYSIVSGGSDTAAGSTGAYTLTITQDSDTDDTIASANAAAVGSTITGKAIDTADDVDLFAVTVTAGQKVAFDIDRPSGSLDSFIRLFNSAGTKLASSNNAPAPGEAATTDSYLEYTFATAGTYYLGVSGNGNSAYSAVTGSGDASSTTTGAYTLVVSDLVIDPDDTIAEATPIAVGGSTSGKTIDVATDVDLYSVTVTAGQRLCFDIDRPSGTLDSYIRLFNSAGTQLAGSNNAPAPGEAATTDSYLEYTFATGGTYYLGVSGALNNTYDVVTGNNDTAAGSTGAYTLTVTGDADPDDTIGGAIQTTVNSTNTGQSIDTATDVDLFAFTVSAGHKIAFDIDLPSGSLDSYIRLFNAAGTQLAGSNNAPAPGEAASHESYTEYTFAADGTYYLGVSGASNNAFSILTGSGDTASLTTGAYTLIITDITPHSV